MAYRLRNQKSIFFFPFLLIMILFSLFHFNLKQWWYVPSPTRTSRQQMLKLCIQNQCNFFFGNIFQPRLDMKKRCAFYIIDVPILSPGLQWKSNQYSSALKCFRAGLTNFMLDVLHRKSTYSLWKQKRNHCSISQTVHRPLRRYLYLCCFCHL